AKVGVLSCLLGGTGVGKTTLLRSLMGLDRAGEGQDAWEGRSLPGLSPHQRVRAGIGYLPQGRENFPPLTVQDNQLMGMSS
ncbi:ATP-binding cassette domain-containing protein, partial [Pseudomonas aeruginosa]|uniref:ATP-binding cassette domain-containing protein n=1 Tax=Pseudomonas aeruginosa TaxID=287 RepID=UPI003CC5C76A